MTGGAVSQQSRDGAAMIRRRYTKEQNDMIAALHKQGVKPAQIAARLSIPQETIKTKLQAWSKGGRYGPRNVAKEAFALIDKALPREDQFAEMLAQGFDVSEIGKVMGYRNYDSANAAFQRLRRHVGKQAR